MTPAVLTMLCIAWDANCRRFSDMKDFFAENGVDLLVDGVDVDDLDRILATVGEGFRLEKPPGEFSYASGVQDAKHALTIEEDQSWAYALEHTCQSILKARATMLPREYYNGILKGLESRKRKP